MKKQILFSSSTTQKRAALLENGKVVELVVERPDNMRLAGNIYRGRITSIVPGLQSAFVDIGLERSAFLHATDIDPSLLVEQTNPVLDRYDSDYRARKRRIPKISLHEILKEGQQIVVQMLKEPIATKGAKVTTQISIPGRFLVLVPDADFIGVSKKMSDINRRKNLKRLIASVKPKGVGVIVRTIGLKVSEDEFMAEMHELIDSWRSIHKEALIGEGPRLLHSDKGITTAVIREFFSEQISEVFVDNRSDYDEICEYVRRSSPAMLNRVQMYNQRAPLFDYYRIEKDLEKSLRRKVWLKSGGYLLFDHAEALLAIDVNTGRNIGKKDLEETIYTTNVEAVEEICRQMRLRDIGGLIVIDFIDMRDKNNVRKIEEAMRKALKRDNSATSMTGLSKFCLMEITRKRVRPELQELMTDACTVCGGLGWVFSPSTVMTRIDRFLHRLSAENKIHKKMKLAVHPAVFAYINKNGQIMEELAQKNQCQITLRENESLDQDEFLFFSFDGTKAITLDS